MTTTAAGEPAVPGFEQDSCDDELFALASGQLDDSQRATRATLVYEYMTEDGQRGLGWVSSDSMSAWESVAALRLVASRVEKMILWQDD